MLTLKLSSIPFFQGVSHDAKFETVSIPEHIRELRERILEGEGGRRDDVAFTFVKGRWNHLGEATLQNRIRSHPGASCHLSPTHHAMLKAPLADPDSNSDVGERWYPELLRKIQQQQAESAATQSTAHNIRPRE